MLGRIAADFDEFPIEWEKNHRNLLESLEQEGLDLFQRWLKVLDEDIDEHEIQPPHVTPTRLTKLIAKLESEIEQLNNAFSEFKKAEVDPNRWTVFGTYGDQFDP